MTNPYGTESHDSEEAMAHEQDAVHEAPSDYEFADEHNATAAEEHTEEQSAISAGAKANRRSPVLPIAAAVGGVFLLGAVAWMQFGGHSSSQSPLDVLAAPHPTNVPSPAAMEMTPPVSTVTPKTASAAPSNDPPPPATPPNAPDPLSILTAAPQTPVQSAPTPVIAPTASVVMPTVAVPAPVPAAVGTIDQRLNALATRMDDLQKTLDQATQQLGQVTNMVAMSAGAPSNKDVQDRLDKLEQEITTLHAMPAKTASHEKPMAPAALAAPSVKTTLKPVVKKVTHEVKPLVKPEAPVSWVLRAASPGQAWVATSAQAHDLKEVHVGDTLPGIGQVTAIQQEGDNWVVKGSKGMIQ